MSVLLIAVVLISATSQTTTPQQFQPQAYTSGDWLNWATTAWAYYAPGVGVNPTTGLHLGTLDWHCFTGWDQAGYIFSIIYARKLNLISDGTGSGDWQFKDRIQKVLTFLETRPLLPGNIPYWAYSSDAIKPYQSCPGYEGDSTDAADSGQLLNALDALRTYDNAYSTQVNNIFTLSEPTYALFAGTCCNGADYYAYLMGEGYRAFGFSVGVFSAIDNYAGPYYPTPVYGQTLPEINTLSEPFALEILTEHPSSKFLDFANRVYLAQMGRWNGGSGPLTAWSEGSYASPPYYIYEWMIVKLSSGTWQTWTLTDSTKSPVSNVPTFAYTRIAFSFLAIYGENAFTDALVGAAKQLASSQGFGEGTFENGASAIGLWGSNANGFYTDKTNELVLAAAAYALQATTFDTNPTSFLGASSPGSTAACGGTFTNGQSSTACGSSFSATANLPSPSTGWKFDHWSWTGGVSCSSSTANPATCSASGGGSLTAVYAAQVTFVTNHSSSASIDWGSCSGPSYENGASMFSTSYGSVAACYVPSGYTPSSWSCSNGLTCSGSNNPTLVTFNGPGTITLNLKTGSLSNPISTSLTASATPSSMHGGTTFAVSGSLTANGVGVSGETVVLVFGWDSNIVTVTTQSGGSYTYTATAPSRVGSYDVHAFFLGDYTGNPQYLPSTATAKITVN